MVNDAHESILLGGDVLSSRFTDFDDFIPLDADEYKTLAQNEDTASLEKELLERVWLKPIQRWLQQKYRIDQRNYTASSRPTLAQLTEDFKVAAALMVDKMSRNEFELSGRVQVAGVGSHVWDNKLPARARQLMERYDRPGGRVERA